MSEQHHEPGVRAFAAPPVSPQSAALSSELLSTVYAPRVSPFERASSGPNGASSPAGSAPGEGERVEFGVSGAGAARAEGRESVSGDPGSAGRPPATDQPNGKSPAERFDELKRLLGRLVVEESSSWGRAERNAWQAAALGELHGLLFATPLPTDALVGTNKSQAIAKVRQELQKLFRNRLVPMPRFLS